MKFTIFSLEKKKEEKINALKIKWLNKDQYLYFIEQT